MKKLSVSRTARMIKRQAARQGINTKKVYKWAWRELALLHVRSVQP